MPTPPAPRRPGRPTASSRDHIEAVAMRLFSENGFAATTVPMIAESSGVGRATVFRYWGSKSEIVWAEFDRHNGRLTTLLAAEQESSDETLDIVRSVVVSNLGLSMEDSPAWIERLELVDGAEELRAEEAQHWAEWATAVAVFVAGRHGYTATDLVPQSIGAAVQAAYLAVLRSPRVHSGVTPDELLPALDGDLRPLTTVLQAWLSDEAASTREA